MYALLATMSRNAGDRARPRRQSARCKLVAIALSLGLVGGAMGSSGASALAHPVLDRVKADGAIRCGAAERPGLLAPIKEGLFVGLLADLCHAIGVAAAGASVKVQMTVYDLDRAYDAVRTGQDDVFFLSGAEIVDQKLGGFILPGPAVFYELIALMVAGGSPVARPSDLADRSICFLQGEASHRHLEAYFAARRLSFVRMGYQEEDELYDAFDAQQCQALAGEVTTLAQVRLDGGKTRREGRILAEPLANFPIVAATNPSDGGWSAIVSWTIATLIDADRPERDWDAKGLDSLPIDAAEIGLAAGWQKAVVAATGGYETIYRGDLGEASPFHIPPGLNALATKGGLMTPPYDE